MPQKNFAEKFSALEKFVRDRLADAPGCHDFDHTARVLRNAEAIASAMPEADPEIVRCAALLHDIARPEELAAGGGICHAALGAEMTPEILAGLGFDAAFAARVADAVRTHRYRDNANLPETPEAAVLYDADKLDSLGAVGIGRAFHFAGRVGARLHNRAETALAGREYGREDTAYREYLVKLSCLKEAMLTAAGREMAERRSAFMDAFFDELNREAGF